MKRKIIFASVIVLVIIVAGFSVLLLYHPQKPQITKSFPTVYYIKVYNGSKLVEVKEDNISSNITIYLDVHNFTGFVFAIVKWSNGSLLFEGNMCPLEACNGVLYIQNGTAPIYKSRMNFTYVEYNTPGIPISYNNGEASIRLASICGEYAFLEACYINFCFMRRSLLTITVFAIFNATYTAIGVYDMKACNVPPWFPSIIKEQ
jgi:hypothetical protein